VIFSIEVDLRPVSVFERAKDFELEQQAGEGQRHRRVILQQWSFV
jgi:hypothetical protein